MKILLFLLAVFFLSISELKAKNADDMYRDGKYAEAEKEYRKADMDNPKDIRYRYNRGCAAFQNSDYKTAEAAFSSVLRRAKDDDMLYKAAYNLGNTAFMQNDFSAAADLYRQAIIHKPDGTEAKHNLELALNKLEQEKQKHGDDKDQKNKKDDNNNSRENKKNDKGDQKSEDKKNGNDKKDNKEQNNKGGDSSNPENRQLNANKMSALDRKKAEALLDNVKEDRAKILQLQMRGKDKNTRTGKNW